MKVPSIIAHGMMLTLFIIEAFSIKRTFVMCIFNRTKVLLILNASILETPRIDFFHDLKDKMD